MRQGCRTRFLSVLLILLCAASAAASQVPVTVSPGTASGVRIGSPCPTFSWGTVAGAKSYELVVYHLGREDEEAEPVLRQELPGSAGTWTPSVDRCLERGGHYAWSVRAVLGRQTVSEWSAPSLFEVTVPVGDPELERAVELVRGFLASRPATEETALAPIGERTPTAGRSDSPRRRGAGPSGPGFSVDGDGTVLANAFLLSCGEGAAATYHRDADGDGLGDPASPGLACVQPSGYVTDSTDCNDADASIDSCGTNQECSGAACICSLGFADCDGNPSDCETGTTGDVENCGDCDVSCSDFNECTDDTCNGGTCSNPSLPEGTSCTGGECDGAGTCVPPPPEVLSASATDETTVAVAFTATIDNSSVLGGGSQFTFDMGLTATAAVASGSTVTVTTTAQSPGTTYTVTVASSVTDTQGTGVSATTNSADFIGWEP